VTDTDAMPIADAVLDVWQNDANQLYSVQDDAAHEAHLRGKFKTDKDGRYAFLGVRPVPYPIPSDGPVGEMLAATARHPWRPAHLHMIVSAEGYETLTTHIFDADSPYLNSDAVFAVKPSPLRRFVHHPADDPERPAQVVGDWWSVANEIVLTPSTDDTIRR
jgi:hydroxyquinol 1,2-dioxygenase